LSGIGATAPILAVLAAIVPQVISIIALGLMIKLLQLQAVPRRLPPGIGLVPSHPEPSNGERRPMADSVSASAPAGQRPQAIWHPDPAADGAWRTAVDVAAGVPATAWGTEAPTVRWQSVSVSAPTDGSIPNGRVPGDPAAQLTVPLRDDQLTVPMHKEQTLGLPGDPRADQAQWNSQPPALDWFGSPRS
jgi:hypothetical protein